MAPTFLWAAQTPHYWWCSIRAEVVGNPRHYLFYGRDAWEGSSLMRCRRQGAETEQPVAVGFFSKNSGFGAEANSKLNFNMTLWTYSDPGSLSFGTTAPAIVDGSVVIWQLSTDSGDLNASVYAGMSPGVAQSLSLGTLTINAVTKQAFY